MAVFPSGTYSPATVSNGNVIDASRDNGQDAEITAIENELRTGLTNPLIAPSLSISGGSTLTTLQATASTFTTVSVSGASTFGGIVTLSSGAIVSSGIIRQNSLPMWNVFRSTHVAIASGSSNGIAFDSQDFVRGNIEHSTTTNSSRVTLNTTGVYRVDASAAVNAGGGNAVVKMHVRLNDVTNLFSAIRTVPSGGTFPDDVRAGHQVRIGSTGYLTCVIVSSGGFGSTAGSSAAHYAIRFSGHFIG